MNDHSLIISDKRILRKIPLTEIMHVESRGMQSHIHTSRGEKHSCCKNLGKLIKELEKAVNFIRVHTSHVINLDHVSTVSKTKQGAVVMKNGTVVPISKRRRSEFFKRYLGC